MCIRDRVRTVAIASYTAFLVLTGQGAQAQPMGQWGGGFGQGLWEAGVENATGGRFSLHCSDDRDGLIFYVDRMAGAPAAAGNVEATLRIDGDNWHWPLRREVQNSGQVMYSWNAGGDAHEMRALVRAL